MNARRNTLLGSVAISLVLPALAGPAGAAPARPDLVVKSLQGGVSATAGKRLLVRDVTRNQGNASAGRSTTRYLLSLDGKAGRGDIALGARKVRALRPRRQSDDRSLRLVPASTPTGRYRLLACADARRRVAERSERNNCRAAATPVEVVPPAPPPPTPACSDGIDNDGDGTTDYRADGSGDPGCRSATDSSELRGNACDDGKDNDLDGKADYKPDGTGDPHCDDAADRSEAGPCEDGVDNDVDGAVDLGDPGCSSRDDDSEVGTAACDDDEDNDDDGLSDFGQDPGCASPGDTSEYRGTACDDGIDNDGDGTVDFQAVDEPADPGCSSSNDASELGTSECDDGVDNDGDGLADHKLDDSGDPGCEDLWSDELGSTECDDGIDNDGDAFVDFRPNGLGDAQCVDPTDTDESA